MIESAIYHAERALSHGSRVPVLGTVPAVLKMIMGAIQIIGGILCCVLSAPFALCSEKARAFFARSFSHIVHGLANIIVAIIEAIPIVGTLFYYVRLKHESEVFSVYKGKWDSKYYLTKQQIPEQITDVIEVKVQYFSPHVGQWIGYRARDFSGTYACLIEGEVKDENYEYKLEEELVVDENIPFLRPRQNLILV